MQPSVTISYSHILAILRVTDLFEFRLSRTLNSATCIAVVKLLFYIIKALVHCDLFYALHPRVGVSQSYRLSSVDAKSVALKVVHGKLTSRY